MAKYLGGAKTSAGNPAAGDQTGTEVCVHTYSNYPYQRAFRWQSAAGGYNKFALRNRLVQSVVGMCANDNVGYSMDYRNEYHDKLKALGWAPTSPAKVGKCRTDCSRSVADNINCAVGSETMPDTTKTCYTGNLASLLTARGWSEVTSQVDFTSGTGLAAGDIVLNEAHHVETYLGTSKTGSKYVKEYKTLAGRYLYPTAKKQVSKRLVHVPKGSTVTYLHSKKTVNGILWRKVTYKGVSGWVHCGKKNLGMPAVSYE